MPSALTLTQRWNKEFARIRQTVKRYEKKGYTFERFNFPLTPKKITERSIANLQRYTTERILSKANVKVGNQVFHIPTAKKRGYIKTPFKFESKTPKIKAVTTEKPIDWHQYFDNEDDINTAKKFYNEYRDKGKKVDIRDIQLQVDGYNKALNNSYDDYIDDYDDYTIYESLKDLDEDVSENLELGKETERYELFNDEFLIDKETGELVEINSSDNKSEIAYSDNEIKEIKADKKILGDISPDDLPDEKEIMMNSFFNSLDTVYSTSYTTPVDEMLDDWDALNVYRNKVSRKGESKVYLGGTQGALEVKSLKKQKADELRRIFEGIKANRTEDEIYDVIYANWDKISDLLEKIMYLAYEEETVSQSLSEFIGLFNVSIDENKEINDRY